jgi:ribosomal protein L35AE/L33A
VKGKHISYQRGKRNTNPGTSLLKLEGVDNTEAAQWYAGKRVAYVYRAQRSVRGSKIRVIWGKVTRPHGSYTTRIINDGVLTIAQATAVSFAPSSGPTSHRRPSYVQAHQFRRHC